MIVINEPGKPAKTERGDIVGYMGDRFVILSPMRKSSKEFPPEINPDLETVNVFECTVKDDQHVYIGGNFGGRLCKIGEKWCFKWTEPDGPLEYLKPHTFFEIG
jgi:hypothetical protein